MSATTLAAPPAASPAASLAGAAERIAALVARCEALADPAVRAEVLELLALVLEIEGAGLARAFAIMAATTSPPAALAACGRDDLLTALCRLHDLDLPAPPPAGAGHGLVNISL